MQWISPILIAAAVGAMYLLYRNGYMPITSKRALTFVGRSVYAKDRCGASFSACTGTLRRVLKCRQTGSYRIALDQELSKGQVSALLLGAKGLCLLSLDEKTPAGRFYLEKGGHYEILISMQSATGSCMLRWEME